MQKEARLGRASLFIEELTEAFFIPARVASNLFSFFFGKLMNLATGAASDYVVSEKTNRYCQLVPARQSDGVCGGHGVYRK